MKRKWNKGFTMAEMLMVVAIIVVLLAVGFIGVQRHQRSLYQVDFDGIAREIYFAAQNHLTQADTQGLVAPKEADQSGNPVEKYTNLAGIGSTEKLNDVYYYIGPRSTTDQDDILSLMLPANAVDTTNSLGNAGTFLILYQKSTATILDVFYTSTDSRFGIGGTFTAENDVDYGKLVLLRDENGTSKKSQRQNASDFNGAIIGYYGGEPALDESITLKAPELKVENGDKLKIIITNPNTGANLNYTTLQLVVTGVRSKKNSNVQPVTIPVLINNENKTVAPTFTSDKSYIVDISKVEDTSKDDYSIIEIVLDDITNGSGHFASIFPDFIPGEDIQVQAKVFSTNTLANIAWSAVAVTNSLFADPYSYTEGKTVLGSAVDSKVAAVSSFRHLENLDGRISWLGKHDPTYELKNVSQIADIDWLKFRESVKDANIKPFTDIAVKSGCYIPVTPQYEGNTMFALTYDGQNHSASNVKVDFAGDAGLFGALTEADSGVKNLKLNDFDIKGTTSAGALVGTIGKADKAATVTVTNVLATHTNKTDAYKTVTIEATAGDAGGLVGYINGGTISKSAAALVVNGTENAGGLIGASKAGTITASYSGGHTYSGIPSRAAQKYNPDKTDDPHKNVYPVRYYDSNFNALYNVTATTNAGGLIGNATDTTITNSYSTCSATAGTVGGFVGLFNGTDTNKAKISNCYCTGLVPDLTNVNKYRGAFIGNLGESTSITGCQYFEIVNEYREMKGGNLTSGYHYLGMLGNGDTNSGITAIDATAKSYNDFCGVSTSWAIAEPYDTGAPIESGLKVFYTDAAGKVHYNFKTVAQLEGASTTVKATDFVATHYGDWPAPEEFIFN